METKEIYSFRKFKTGTHSALLGKFGITFATTMALMTAGGVAHANQVSVIPIAPATTQVVPSSTKGPTTTKNSSVPTSVPEGTTQSTAEKTINSTQDSVKSDVTTATDTGVKVTTGPLTDVTLNESNVVSESNRVLTDLNKQDQAVKDATVTQQANTKAYTDAKTSRDTAVSQGQSDISHSTQDVKDQIAIAEKNKLDVTTTTNLTPKYVDTKGLTGQALTDAMSKNIVLFNKAVKDSVAMMDASSVQMKKQITDYLNAMAKYQAGFSTNTGLQWQNGVVLEAGDGVTKQTGTENVVDFGDGTIKTAGMYATHGQNLDQNTDAYFDNIFKINGTGTILVKNTTNGDVKLTFSDLNAPYNTGTYVAIWGDDKGGIAWSVFALYNGSSNGGAGETGGSNTGISGGRILDYIKSYKATAETTKGISVVTFNDIDNQQTVSMSGLDGAKISKGINITQNGNNFVAGAGDVSQGSSGDLGTNGVKWQFSSADTRSFSFVHKTDGAKNTSIVGGIFGAASDVLVKPVAPKLTAKLAVVTAPVAPEAPKPVEVTVHYYNVKTTPVVTPTPKTPTQYVPTAATQVAASSVLGLPHTGDETENTVVQMAIGLLLVSFAGLSVIKTNKKKEKLL
ncbi:signal peptide protein [Streptococcus parauberis]|nr:signal peptide protein [Streptococcus parauberis]